MILTLSFNNVILSIAFRFTIIIIAASIEALAPIINHNRVQNLVAGLASKGITLTEWGSALQ